MPSLLALLLGFTPENVANIINVNDYLGFIIQLMLFFGIGCLIPLIFVMLNFAGVLTGRAAAAVVALAGHRLPHLRRGGHPDARPVQHAASSPLPFMGIVAVAVVVMLLNDARRRRATSRLGYGQWADDEVSDLPEPIVDPEDLRPSPLDDDIT